MRFNNRLTNFVLVTQLFVYKKYKINSLQISLLDLKFKFTAITSK